MKTFLLVLGIIFSIFTVLAQTPAQNRASTVVSNEAFKVEQLLSRDATLWHMTSQDFMSEFRALNFRWTSDAKTTARAYVLEGARLMWMEYSVIEMLADFSNDKLSKMTVILYSRGDAGQIDIGEFRKAIAKIGSALNQWSGVKEPAEIKQTLPVGGMKMQVLAWVKGPHQVVGEWSYSELSNGYLQPEYIRVRLERYDDAKDPRSALKTSMNSISAKRKGLVTKSELRKNVIKEENNDIVIRNVPMVDQGAKGYCSVATMERILSYYGLEADQHKMAQLAQTNESGTDSVSLLAGLKRVGPSLGFRVEEVISLNYNRLEQFAKRYDAEAKKVGKRQSYWTPPVVDVTRFYLSLEPEILRDIKTKDLNSKIFINKIKEKIDQGIPLVWAVMLGFVEEDPKLPQARGGHMRMIIGYNAKTNEILYTDSWGAGHEFKRMSFDDAWMITMELMVVSPSALVH